MCYNLAVSIFLCSLSVPVSIGSGTGECSLSVPVSIGSGTGESHLSWIFGSMKICLAYQ